MGGRRWDSSYEGFQLSLSVDHRSIDLPINRSMIGRMQLNTPFRELVNFLCAPPFVRFCIYASERHVVVHLVSPWLFPSTDRQQNLRNWMPAFQSHPEAPSVPTYVFQVSDQIPKKTDGAKLPVAAHRHFPHASVARSFAGARSASVTSSTATYMINGRGGRASCVFGDYIPQELPSALSAIFMAVQITFTTK